jgi:hypothetical protein
MKRSGDMLILKRCSEEGLLPAFFELPDKHLFMLKGSNTLYQKCQSDFMVGDPDYGSEEAEWLANCLNLSSAHPAYTPRDCEVVPVVATATYEHELKGRP